MAAALSVVVPVYNSELSLEPLINELARTLPSLVEAYEVILVEDDSRDNSWQVVCSLAAAHGWVRGFKLMRNYGQHNALLCGIRAARYPVIVTMDDDLQHPPEEIPQLLAMLEQGYDVVYGSPQREAHGLLRDLASQVTKMVLQGTMGTETARNLSAFRAFRTSLRDSFAGYRGPYVNIDVLLTWGTARFTSVRVRHEPRRLGESNYTLRKLVSHTFNMMTGFSTIPLQIASMLGFMTTLFGFGVLVYVIGRYLIQGTTVEGFPFLASIITIFAGAQLFALGIMGEYLARIHFRVMDRPPYSVREAVGQDQN